VPKKRANVEKQTVTGEDAKRELKAVAGEKKRPDLTGLGYL
jgi:hypothetical protein